MQPSLMTWDIALQHISSFGGNGNHIPTCVLFYSGEAHLLIYLPLPTPTPGQSPWSWKSNYSLFQTPVSLLAFEYQRSPRKEHSEQKKIYFSLPHSGKAFTLSSDFNEKKVADIQHSGENDWRAGTVNIN